VTSDEAADLVSNIMMEDGCGGAAITGPSVHASGAAELPSDEPIPEHTTVTGYLPVDDSLEGRLENISDRFRSLPEVGVDIGLGEINVKPVEDADWAQAWRSFFKPLEVGSILVKPSWEDVDVRLGQIVVEIDPGMAFGTGNHPTTQLCLLALQRLVQGGEKMLDVGTGSGILTIAAIKLGVAEVVATEIDAVAVEAARENMLRNGIDGVVSVLQAETPDGLMRDADIAVANITADPIMRLAPSIATCMRPGGTLLISGVIDQRADEVLGCLARHGFEIVGIDRDDGWVAVVLTRGLTADSTDTVGM
jgi:ribosomal protein L11 methyltransferase